MASPILILHVRKEYFDQIAAGDKIVEYRLITPFWSKMLSKEFTHVKIGLGYPKNEQSDRWITFTWDGFYTMMIRHKEFGDKPVAVYAIRLYRKSCRDTSAISQ